MAASTCKTPQKNVTHCIFDMDGLLLDTEVIYERIYGEIVAMHGKTLTAEVRFKILGTNEQNACRIVIEDLELPMTSEEFMIIYKKMTRERMNNVQLMKGAERLLCHFHKHGIPIALATSSAEEMVDIKTKNHRELFKLFCHRVCGSSDPDVKQGKPAPDIFLVAASRFPDQPNPANCLVFEDAPNGVQGASSAGMQCVMVPDERVPSALRALATQVLHSLEDFKPEDFGLPAFDAAA